jgi:membrane-associated phospholipid phosphatase
MSAVRTSAWSSHVHRVVTASACLLALGALAIVVSSQRVPNFELEWFRSINDWPDGLRYPIWPIMQLGTLGAALAVAAASWLVWRDWRASVAVIVSGVTCYLGAKVVKSLVERGRPVVYVPDLHLREHYDGGFGFASGHTAVAFGTATALTVVLGTRGRVAAFALAATVGVGRIYFGAHLPLDVVGGACIGIAVGSIAKIVTRADRRAVEAVAQPHQRPSPS